MTSDKYHPIPGEMDSIDCLRKELDELKEDILGEQAISRLRYLEIEKLKEKLGIAVYALEAIRTHQQISVGANNPLMYELSTTWNIANSTLGKIGEVNK